MEMRVWRAASSQKTGETRHGAPGAPYRLFTIDCGPGGPTTSHPSHSILGPSLYWKAFATLPDSNYQSWIAKSIAVDFDLDILCPYLCLCLVLCLCPCLCLCHLLALVLCFLYLRIEMDQEQLEQAVRVLYQLAISVERDRQASAFEYPEMQILFLVAVAAVLWAASGRSIDSLTSLWHWPEHHQFEP